MISYNTYKSKHNYRGQFNRMYVELFNLYWLPNNESYQFECLARKTQYPFIIDLMTVNVTVHFN